MQNSKTKKVKTFRISETTQYKLKKLKEYMKKSEGKVLEQLINSAYYQLRCEPCMYPADEIKNIEEAIRIANTEWVIDRRKSR